MPSVASTENGRKLICIAWLWSTITHLWGLAGPVGDGRQGYRFHPILVQSSDVLVSAMSNNKGETHLRLYEHRGKESQASLDCTMDKAHWSDVDLECRELADPSNSLVWRPWQIRTVRLDIA